MNTRIAWVVIAGLLVAADSAKEEAAKQDLAKMQGTWSPVSYIIEGKSTPAADLVKTRLTVSGNQSTFVVGKATFHGTYALDATTKPRSIDITFKDGPDKGKKKLGLYAFEKEQMQICLAVIGAPRPKEIKAGPGVNLEVWQRAKIVAKPADKKADMEKKAAAAPAKPAPPAPPPFADKNLDAAVRAALHEPSAPLTESNLLNVHILDASSKGITSLKGLEKCKNLMQLNLAKNQVADIGPVRDLGSLQWLDVADNKVADIGPLAGLTKLQYLNLSNNQVSRIDSLAGLVALNAVELTNNKVADLGPLSKLTKLWSLYASRNQIKDLKPLAGLTWLSTLDLADNQISDLAPLAKMTDLKSLIIERNKITDLTPLISFLKADAQGEKRVGPFLRLYLSGNPLSESTKAGQLQALKSFGVHLQSS